MRRRFRIWISKEFLPVNEVRRAYYHKWEDRIAQTLKMRRDVKLLYDIMEDTINLQLAKIHVRSTYRVRDEIMNSVRSALRASLRSE